jgi:hypothetical protein
MRTFVVLFQMPVFGLPGFGLLLVGVSYYSEIIEKYENRHP